MFVEWDFLAVDQKVKSHDNFEGLLPVPQLSSQMRRSEYTDKEFIELLLVVISIWQSALPLKLH